MSDIFDPLTRPSPSHYWDHRVKHWRDESADTIRTVVSKGRDTYGQTLATVRIPAPYVAPTRCAYCRTGPQISNTCPNCGAPQHD